MTKRICEPVRGLGRMVNGSYQFENHEYDEDLIEGREGKDPLTIPAELLSAAGHPRRSINELRIAMGYTTRGEKDRDLRPMHVKSYTQIKTFCAKECAGGEADAMACRVTNCPFWAYRTGKNPHDKRRGKTIDHLKEWTY